jgi:hypothetical protein
MSNQKEPKESVDSLAIHHLCFTMALEWEIKIT